MSGKFDGFTEEDIRKLTSRGTKDQQKTVAVGGLRVAKLQHNTIRHQVKKNVARDRISQSGPQSKMFNEKQTSPDKMLTNGTSLPHEPIDHTSDEPVTEKKDCSDPVSRPVDSQPDYASSESPNQVSVCLRIREGRSYEVMGSEKISLEEFQARQKLMEEQNRRRKEVLSKALSDRKKQTHAESQRLQQIQDELQKLDVLLSNDVSILRNQIEVASLEFNEAQKRYSKAEKEFLDAKIKMFGKLEQKELLTEHLCTIIEQNEMRKARKLSELMEKLELGITIDLSEDHISSSSPSLETNVGIESKLLNDIPLPEQTDTGTTSIPNSTNPKMQIEVNKTSEHLTEIENIANLAAELQSEVSQ